MQNKIDLTTQKIDKICVLMMGLLGDVAMRTPILNQIKRIYPNAKMSVVVDKIGSQVLKNNPDIDEMIIIDRKKANKFKYICSKISVQAKLILGSFDLIIDLYMGRSSCNMAKFSFAKYQIGILHGQFWSNKNLKCHKFEHEFANPYHITNGLFEILQYFNVKQNSLDTKPIVHVDAKIDEKMRNYSEELRIKHYLLSLGSGGLEKLLDMQKSFELAEYMYKKYELIPAIFLNPTQEYLQEKFVSEFLEPNQIPYKKLDYLSIEEIVSLMKFSKFIIVPDTGLFHLAVGVGLPIYSVFAYTNPKWVEPSGGIFKIVFKDGDEIDVYSRLKFGTKDIDIEFLKSEFDEFYDKLDKNSGDINEFRNN